MDYQTLYRHSLDHPDEFWADAASDLVWAKPWEKVLDDSDAPFYEWFSGGKINTCYNALDRHCEEGRADQAALIYDSPVTGQVRTFSYAELRDEVATFAGALRKYGVGKGDRVIIYLPMIPEAVISMLACARIGAIHSVVFGGFAAHELATRVVDAGPKLVISASCGIEGQRVIPYLPLLDQALELAGVPDLPRILVNRPQLPIGENHPAAVVWQDAVERMSKPRNVSLSAQPIRFTSCTRPERPVSPRAWSDPMEDTRSPSNGA